VNLDAVLRTMATASPPPPSAALEAVVRAPAPVRTRAPMRHIAALVALSIPLALLHAYANGLRTDLARVPLAWLVAVGLAWLLAFVAPIAAVMVPARASVIAEPSRVIGAAALVPAFVVVLGTTLAGSVSPAPTGSGIGGIVACLISGLEVAAMPFAAAILALRHALPVDARAIGAALGGAGGALGGFALHLQCEAGGAMHTGFGHAGAAVVGAFAGWAIIAVLQRGR
jgi:hypothetical protein